MAVIIWAPSALCDIDAIADFIARDSVDNAALFVTRLIEATEHLKEFPCAGRIIPEIKNPLCREIIYKNYRIMYYIKEKSVWITGVIHGSQDW